MMDGGHAIGAAVSSRPLVLLAQEALVTVPMLEQETAASAECHQPPKLPIPLPLTAALSL